MKALWAPWRMEYIVGGRAPECIFCCAAQAKDDERHYVLWRGKQSLVLLNTYPYNNGHLMVSPYRHVDDLTELSREELLEMMGLVQSGLQVLRREISAEGFNVGLNLGKAAGAGIADHVHFHVVPRWVGDTNFMPVIADTKVMPEYLRDTYSKLCSAFRTQLK